VVQVPHPTRVLGTERTSVEIDHVTQRLLLLDFEKRSLRNAILEGMDSTSTVARTTTLNDDSALLRNVLRACAHRTERAVLFSLTYAEQFLPRNSWASFGRIQNQSQPEKGIRKIDDLIVLEG